jgi:hypothetical protein
MDSLIKDSGTENTETTKIPRRRRTTTTSKPNNLLPKLSIDQPNNNNKTNKSLVLILSHSLLPSGCWIGMFQWFI